MIFDRNPMHSLYTQYSISVRKAVGICWILGALEPGPDNGLSTARNGIYQPGCGIGKLMFSWGHDERPRIDCFWVHKGTDRGTPNRDPQENSRNKTGI